VHWQTADGQNAGRVVNQRLVACQGAVKIAQRVRPTVVNQDDQGPKDFTDKTFHVMLKRF
jgi:hypothetical protein